ncbi:hypothetical protein L2E82_22528 [Cichorium intybus]|uniref:Uncharacterized protein n=1 Tax=Cichorium intybus TaxID=13427 RepID=A0ACB9DY13_CICIN|nr:hypothetical protein L2E82_22528 [Cichorium intybus]
MCPPIVRILQRLLWVFAFLDSIFVWSKRSFKDNELIVGERNPCRSIFLQLWTVGQLSDDSSIVIYGRKRKISTARVVNAMKKREGAFRADLWATLKSFMEKNGNKTINSLSLNDLLLHVTEGNHRDRDPRTLFETGLLIIHGLIPANAILVVVHREQLLWVFAFLDSILRRSDSL